MKYLQKIKIFLRPCRSVLLIFDSLVVYKNQYWLGFCCCFVEGLMMEMKALEKSIVDWMSLQKLKL